jgi:hypothetical protein
MGYLIDIIVGAVSRIVTGELSAHAEPLARWIISRAVVRLPADHRDRAREEWLSHRDETPGTLRKLLHAVGCYLAAAKVADMLAQKPAPKNAAAVIDDARLKAVWLETFRKRGRPFEATPAGRC